MKQSKVKILLYLQAFAVIGVIESFLNAILNHSLFSMITALLSAGCIGLLYGKTSGIHKEEILLKKRAYEGYAEDHFFKRCCNLLCILIADITIVTLNLVMACLMDSSKLAENITSARPSLQIAEIILVLAYVSWKELNLLGNCDDLAEKKAYIKKILLLSAVYWGIYSAVSLLFGFDFYNMSFAAAVLSYLFLVLIFNLTLRKKVTVRNFYWKKTYTAVITGFIVFCFVMKYLKRDTFYLQGYINQVPRIQQNTAPISYDDDSGRYRIEMTEDEFKILQLTDIHFGGSLYSLRKDYKALKAVYDLIAYARPDLVIVTGDMTFPLGIMSFSLNNSSAVHQFAAFMRNVNIPWAFTFGNHDTEAMASSNTVMLCELYESLSFKVSGTLLYPYDQPEITGRNNQVIELYNTDGTLNQALFLIDSNAYTGEGINEYDYIHDDQVEWYEGEIKRLNEQEGKTVSSMAFFHIPLQQYRTAYELYEQGSDEVTYFFGRNDEEMIDKVCCSDYPSGLFDKMKELGSTTALFCGHDHYNNMSLEYQGIRLTYGMSIDYLAMPGIEKSEQQRGGTLITISSDSSYTIEQIPLNSIRE